jgi:hypothetical protein
MLVPVHGLVHALDSCGLCPFNHHASLQAERDGTVACSHLKFTIGIVPDAKTGYQNAVSWRHGPSRSDILSFDSDLTRCQPPASRTIMLGNPPHEIPGAGQAEVN